VIHNGNMSVSNFVEVSQLLEKLKAETDMRRQHGKFIWLPLTLRKQCRLRNDVTGNRQLICIFAVITVRHWRQKWLCLLRMSGALTPSPSINDSRCQGKSDTSPQLNFVIHSKRVTHIQEVPVRIPFGGRLSWLRSVSPAKWRDSPTGPEPSPSLSLPIHFQNYFFATHVQQKQRL